MHIGTFAPAKDGGWIGYIRTLAIDAKGGCPDHC